MGGILNYESKYGDILVEIVPKKYGNNRLALLMVDALNKEPVTTVTVNIPEAPLNDDEIIVKSYSENEGMLEYLVENDLVEDTGKFIPTGFVVVNIVKMTEKFKSIIGLNLH